MRLKWFIIAFCMVVLATGCSLFEQENTPGAEQHVQGETAEQTGQIPAEQQADGADGINESPSVPREREARSVEELQLMVVGDIMMHMPQIEAGKTAEGYDFSPFFEKVQPVFEQADLVLGNLETTFGGPERGYSGYPLFSAPDELAEALKQAGFDVITTANNHSLDSGPQGLIRTIDTLEAAGLHATGTFRSTEERADVLVVEHNNISVAVLAYTYGTNGIPLPEGKEYLVNLLNEEEMKTDIKRAKQEADFVAVCIHFGAEYQSDPNEEQIQWVDKLFDWGADLIFGSHPHVLQPYEFREWVQDGTFRQGVVIYSLGNFISNQREHPRDIGGILSVNLTKVGDQARIEDVDFIPTYVHRYWQDGQRAYQVLPMKTLVEERAYPQISEEDYNQLHNRYQQTLEHVTPAEKIIRSGPAEYLEH
ncbi:poly-gamma-glutamate synthesis protein (capsule biosynthesis protein) [Caldalkalibacillus uzonensis]|uniref:Poly-gamma-glutamate synthesis protein (Capsule biosynthesis protein) n=1 Tax=Caldalkalibacillus uzonensis TaxID=353224 RepID=A0ABU0CMD7_9BACI|nr:CapA family protein [Caldalkalibacillus uzonensis]MDQ0337573.1 poly-gamma-glutamate synthesis protein (capsule biosynthesis protein) [Caldalkalibacillus uzonensis]